MPDRSARPKRSTSHSRVFGLALSAAATLIALVLAEAALRLLLPEVGKLRELVTSTDDERGFAPKPGLRIPFDGVFSPLRRTIVWQTNAEGLRHEGEVGSATERFRVATYGDSETFGWAVELEDTFQRQMERLDPRVEVLNFGVPGYNVTNVRAHLEGTLSRYQPDLVLYLVNKNDFNEPVTFTALSYSHLLLHLRFLWHFTIGKQLRLGARDTLERREIFAREVERMTCFLEARDTPFVLGFLRWKNRTSLREHVSRSLAASASGRFRRELVDVQAALEGERKEDTHYAEPAHRKLAALLCRVISGGAGGSCVPPAWRREGPAAGAATARR